MPTQTIRSLALAVIAATLAAFSPYALAQSVFTYRVIHDFSTAAGGINPRSTLTLDSAGNLYGTTSDGGLIGLNGAFGTAFELSPAGNTWSQQLLYTFDGTRDGRIPSDLTFDSSGNLYGVTHDSGSGSLDGNVFELSPTQSGSWILKILHNFDHTNGDGKWPINGVVFDHAGNLFGVTAEGGTGQCYDLIYYKPIGCGVIFELSPTTSGDWTEKILYNFQSDLGGSGVNSSKLIFDTAGDLFGAAEYEDFKGSVFELKQTVSGTWVERTIHSFGTSKDGVYPNGPLVLDTSGNIYGTTLYGGANACSCGTVFELIPRSNGSWDEKILHSFADDAKDGINPIAGLTYDAGALYGTTTAGGRNQAGMIFELTPNPTGSWNEKILHTFGGNAKDGELPVATMLMDAAGNLYGTTSRGGSRGNGTVFELIR